MCDLYAYFLPSRPHCLMLSLTCRTFIVTHSLFCARQHWTFRKYSASSTTAIGTVTSLSSAKSRRSSTGTAPSAPGTWAVPCITHTTPSSKCSSVARWFILLGQFFFTFVQFQHKITKTTYRCKIKIATSLKLDTYLCSDTRKFSNSTRLYYKAEWAQWIQGFRCFADHLLLCTFRRLGTEKY